MATNFPTSVDDGTTLADPSAGNFQNSPDHASLHGNANGAIKAIEAKVGTGASTPTNNTLLRGNGVGTSAWAALTSAQLAACLSDETGSGFAVFATTPTLVTPKVDTINESTPSNGTTIGGVNIKSGALNTNNSVVTANITNAAVTANKLATGAASAFVSTTETTTSTSYAFLTTTTDQVTVTIGINGLALVAIASGLFNSGANDSFVSIDISGATTTAANDNMSIRQATTAAMGIGATFLITGLTAGSTTFKLKYRVSAGTGSFFNRRIGVVPL